MNYPSATSLIGLGRGYPLLLFLQKYAVHRHNVFGVLGWQLVFCLYSFSTVCLWQTPKNKKDRTHPNKGIVRYMAVGFLVETFFECKSLLKYVCIIHRSFEKVNRNPNNSSTFSNVNDLASLRQVVGSLKRRMQSARCYITTSFI